MDRRSIAGAKVSGNEPSGWVCLQCTVVNSSRGAACTLCGTKRPLPMQCCVRFMHGGEPLRIFFAERATVGAVCRELRSEHGPVSVFCHGSSPPLETETELGGLQRNADNELELFALPRGDIFALVDKAALQTTCRALRTYTSLKAIRGLQAKEAEMHKGIMQLVAAPGPAAAMPESPCVDLLDAHLSATCDSRAVQAYCDVVAAYVRATAALPFFQFKAAELNCDRLQHYAHCFSVARAVALDVDFECAIPLFVRSPDHAQLSRLQYVRTAGQEAHAALRLPTDRIMLPVRPQHELGAVLATGGLVELPAVLMDRLERDARRSVPL